jgi:hypothetical protein
MAADIFVAESWKAARANPSAKALVFEDDGYYWHLYRYFEGANLDRRHELIDLYGGGEIIGYQLDRLEDELNSALADASCKPAEWRVLTGWNERPARENEIWREVERETLIEMIHRMLWLIKFAREKNLQLFCSGD